MLPLRWARFVIVRNLFGIMLAAASADSSAQTLLPSTRLRVSSVARDAHASTCRVRLRNDASQLVVAFVLLTPDGETIHELLGRTKTGIGPGAELELGIGCLSPASTENVVVAALIFADGTSEGSLQDARKIDDIRQGRLFELDRLGSVLDTIAKSTDGELIGAITAGISGITSSDLLLPDGTKAAGLYGSGVRAAHTTVVNYLNNVLQAARKKDFASARGLLASYQIERSRIVSALVASRLR